MKKNVLIFGLIAGLIVSVVMAFVTTACYENPDFKNAEIIGYTSMLVAFCFIFVGIKKFRDQSNEGVISFGKAFMVGFYIALVASTIYVIVWMVNYYCFIPDFMEKYSGHVLNELKESGAPQVEIDSKMKELAFLGGLYNNPFSVALLTYAEILPMGVVISLISALILKRKTKKPATV